jgi:hypothetical protein
MMSAGVLNGSRPPNDRNPVSRGADDLSGRLHFDFALLLLSAVGLGHDQLQHALATSCRDLVGIDAVGQAEGPDEA